MITIRKTFRGLRRILTTHSRQRDGLTLVEVTISVVIVGVMMVAAVTTVGSVSLSRWIQADRSIGRLLAEQLMVEIVSKEYEDPGNPGGLGTEPDELAAGNRSPFDDVDDYDGWSASPPQYSDGSAIPDRDDWERSVEVAYVDGLDFTQSAASDESVKRITVTVKHNGAEAASLVAVRARTEPQ